MKRKQRIISEPKKRKVAGNCKKSQESEFLPYHLFASIFKALKSRMNGGVGCLECMGEKGNDHRILIGRPKGKRPFERHQHRWKDIKIDIKEI